ncbi:RHS repeat domain-containing protein [Empedobacter brevis]|uniref:RHS repeat domain-containing protein n=1 Tax=Empedobacter brevis TaxID=247 RepID=UPI00133087A7|nr:RHS repeat domain-containing protein [Empedobacter brevis]
MKKNIVLLSLIILSINKLSAQQQNTTNYKRNSFDIASNLFTTPEVTQFQKTTFFESNNYTGKIDLKIPIYDVKYGEISVPVYLTYNSGGIKVDDVATDVGLGWSLVAGGSIIRNIKDIKDDTFTPGRYGREDWDIGWEPFQFASEVGYYNKPEDIFKSHVSLGHVEGDFEQLAKIDASPDLFYISAPDVSSSFYLKNRENLNEYNAVQLSGKELLFNPTFTGSLNVNQIGFDNRTIRGIEGLHLVMSVGGNPIGTPIQIKDISQYGRHDFKQFEFKNTNGSYYKFDQVDIIESIPNVLNLGKTMFGLPPMYIETRFGYKSYPTTWHLSEIKDYNSNKVEFKYDNYANPYVKKTREKSNDSYRYVYNPFSSGNNTNNCDIGLYPTFKYKNSHGITSGEVDEQHYKAQEFYSIQRQRNRIKEIKWENNVIEFIYSKNRKDYPNEKSLDEIIIRNGNNIIKKIKLYYDYFNASTSCSDWSCFRLKLDKIEYVDLDNKAINSYKFDYYYDNPLPKVYSSQQDFLGFYNANGVEQSNDLDNKVPILYFHRNQGRFSILPFQRTDGTFTKTIPGQFSLAPNNYSLTGLLKKVTFPTGGTSEFEYENHKFIFNEKEYLAGGARIKKQILNDNNGSRRVLNYDYTENGKSSGVINNLPVYGQIWGFDRNDVNKMSFVSFDKPKNEIELTEGAFVGYSKVKIFEEGNGSTEYNFTTVKDFPNENIKSTSYPNFCVNTLHQNSSFPNIAYIDNDIKRGKLISKNTYNSSNILIQNQTNEYKHTIFNEEIIPFQRFINNYFDDPYYTRPEGITSQYENKLRVERNLLSKQETKEYLAGGVVSNIKEMTYDAVYPFVKQEKTINSKDEILITDNEYVFERTDELSKRLTDDNRVSEPLRTVYKNGDHIISSTYNHYSDFNGIIRKAHILQKSKALVEYSDTNARKISYDSYDTKGNLTQYTLENGIPVSIIWGYKGQYPIAKIEGSTNTELSNYIQLAEGNIQSNNDTYELIFEKIREHFPNSMITTYLYQPLVGVTSITAPNGQTEYYKYDEFGRLVEIRNDKKEVIKTFEYKYKP